MLEKLPPIPTAE